MARHRRKCLPDPDVTVMCITLQRKRRESASSSSSVKKVKKPWWGQEHQLVHGRGQGAVWVTVFTAEIPKVLGLDKKDTGEQDAIILSIYVEAPLTHTHTHIFQLPMRPLQPLLISSQHLCDKGNNWVTFHSITARLPASTIAEP